MGKGMSFSMRKLTLFLGTLGLFMMFGTEALAAAANFPDLGVVGDHRLMAVVGFAQQDFYFDQFKFGGLQTLALTFALIGGLLILLIPKNHNFITIFSYLFLVFILIVAPAPSNDSLFFYDLGAVPERWNCPVPPTDRGLSMEEFCKNGKDSVSGNIADTLSAYTMNFGSGANDAFGAFVPQLVTIHFFTAVERTLLQALWGNTVNATHPGDLMGPMESSDVVADAVSNNPNIRYYNTIYSSICSSHTDLLRAGDFTVLPRNMVLSAAMDTFTFEDAIIANIAYYRSRQDRRHIYPVRAATARISPNDYTKSLSFTGTAANVDRQAFATAIRADLNLDGPMESLEAFKVLRRASDEPLIFPHSSNMLTSTNIFKALISADDDYSRQYEPDPYDYSSSAVGGARVPDGTTSLASTNNEALWTTGDLTMTRSGGGYIARYGEFKESMKLWDAAVLDTNSTSNLLAESMRDYPVQLYIPYVSQDRTTVHLGTAGTASSAGPPIQPAPRGLLPRNYSARRDLGGIDLQNQAANNFTPAVQSCLDFAALINSRRYFAMEEAGLIDLSMDLRAPLTTGQLIELVEFTAARTDDEDRQSFYSTLGERARIALQRQGCSRNAAGVWTGATGCSSGSATRATYAGDIPEAVCSSMIGFVCTLDTWRKSIWNDFQDSWESSQSGNFSSITNSPQGATSYGGINSYTAAGGDFIVKYGLMVASWVQGFVYGAYMKLMPVIIGYGIALTLFMTPFVFLMGIAVPMQARSVIIAPIVAIAFLKTVSIALVVVDHSFVSLMFWVERVNVSDPELYKAMLIMAHLTASVSLFSLAGLLLFGLNDPGSFVKHLSSMDKAGQVSFNEALAAAAPVAIAAGVAKKGIGMAKDGYQGGHRLAGSMKARKGLSEADIMSHASAVESRGLEGMKDRITGRKARAEGALSQLEAHKSGEKAEAGLSMLATGSMDTRRARKRIARVNQAKSEAGNFAIGTVGLDSDLKYSKGAPNTTDADYQLKAPPAELMSKIISHAGMNKMDTDQVSAKVQAAFQEKISGMTSAEKKALFKSGGLDDNRTGFVSVDNKFAQELAVEALGKKEAANFAKVTKKDLSNGYLVMDEVGEKSKLDKLKKDKLS